MTRFVGLDVSQKITAICVVDDAGRTLELHPTVKPIALVADALLDVTKQNDIVIDPFCGSGATILAAERTGRHGCGIEIDPLYVDTYENWALISHIWNSSLACGRAQASQPNASRSSSHLIAPLIASATAEAWKASVRESPLSSGCSRSSPPMSITDGSLTESY